MAAGTVAENLYPLKFTFWPYPTHVSTHPDELNRELSSMITRFDKEIPSITINDNELWQKDTKVCEKSSNLISRIRNDSGIMVKSCQLPILSKRGRE